VETDWEEGRCPVCDANAPRLFREVPTHPRGEKSMRVVRCTACEALYANPRPTEAALGRWYVQNYCCNQFYPRGGGAPSLRDRLFNALFVRGRDQARIKFLTEHLPEVGPHTRVLDFGCGAGSFLCALREQCGCRVAGIESAPALVRRLRDELHVPAGATLAELREPDPLPFDVITLCHALEHLYEPTRTLRQLRAAAHAQTRLIVEVPHAESWPARRFGAAWLGWDAPRHLSHFTPSSLRAVLARSGWRATEPVFPNQAIGLTYSLAAQLGFEWLNDMHGHLYKILALYSLLAPAGAWLSRAGKNDMMIVVAVPA
jgi:SAM-dependent methyltransferase